MRNEFQVNGDTTTIFIPYKGQIHNCLIDTEDLPLVSKYSWHVKPIGGKLYARANTMKDGKRYQPYMHRLIIEKMLSEETEKEYRQPLPSGRFKRFFSSVKRRILRVG